MRSLSFIWYLITTTRFHYENIVWIGSIEMTEKRSKLLTGINEKQLVLVRMANSHSNWIEAVFCSFSISLKREENKWNEKLANNSFNAFVVWFKIELTVCRWDHVDDANVGTNATLHMMHGKFHSLNAIDFIVARDEYRVLKMWCLLRSFVQLKNVLKITFQFSFCIFFFFLFSLRNNCFCGSSSYWFRKRLQRILSIT